MICIERQQPVLSYLDNAFGRSQQADDQRIAQAFNRHRQRHIRHKRDIGRLEAAVGKVDAGRRFRRAADAEQ